MDIKIRYRLNLQIFYENLTLSIKDSAIVDNEDKLRKYCRRYFDLNFRDPVVVAFFFPKK